MPVADSNEIMEYWQVSTALMRSADELDGANGRMSEDERANVSEDDKIKAKFLRQSGRKLIRDLHEILAKKFQEKKESLPVLMKASPYSDYFPLVIHMLSVYTDGHLEEFEFHCPSCDKFVPLGDFSAIDFQEWLFLIHQADMINKISPTTSLNLLFTEYRAACIAFNDKVEDIEYLYTQPVIAAYVIDLPKGEQALSTIFRTKIKKKSDLAPPPPSQMESHAMLSHQKKSDSQEAQNAETGT